MPFRLWTCHSSSIGFHVWSVAVACGQIESAEQELRRTKAVKPREYFHRHNDGVCADFLPSGTADKAVPRGVVNKNEDDQAGDDEAQQSASRL